MPGYTPPDAQGPAPGHVGVKGHCAVEDALGTERSLELDMLLADPSLWPRSTFAGWKMPGRGALPSSMRRWGAVKIGLEWCKERGVILGKDVMARHYKEHVPVIPFTMDDYAEAGRPKRRSGAVNEDSTAIATATGPVTFLDVYREGLRIGYRALGLLAERIEEMVAKEQKPPVELLTKMADYGTKLAMSQAGIRARGLEMAREADEEIEGFRSGAAPLPSQRFGQSRVRVIEGEARPVQDRGRADRREYNERAKQEGSPTLPA